MRIHRPSNRLALLFAALVSASAAVADSPLERVRGAPRSDVRYAFELRYETAEITAIGHVDPSKPAGQRVTVLSPPKDRWPEGFEQDVAEIDATPDEDFWCHDLLDAVPPDAQLLEETDTTAIYQFQPLPDEGDAESEHIVKHLVGTIVIDKQRPAVLSMALSATKPFRINWLARVETMNVHAHCAREPGGATYLETLDTRLTGTALFKSFVQREVRSIGGLRPVSIPAT